MSAPAKERPAPQTAESVPPWCMWLALGIAAVVRLHTVAVTALNPDEAMHVVWADAATWTDLIAYAGRIQHPPLLLLVLRVIVGTVGRSDLLLRLPFLVANVAACCFCFLWVRRLANPRAAFFALVFLACSPAMVTSGSELRQLSLTIALLCPALWAFDRGLAGRARWSWGLFVVCALCALLSHYSAVLVLAAIAAYGLMCRPSLGRAVALGVIGTLLVGGLVIYLTGANPLWHLRAMRKAPAYLADHLYGGGLAGVLPFAGSALLGTWTTLSGDRAAAWLACGVALLGLWGARSHAVRLLLAAPFVFALAAALAGIYPMGQTRHVGYLLPFAAAAVGIGLHRLTARLGIPALVILLVWAAIWPINAAPDNRRAHVYRIYHDKLLDVLETTVPQEAPVVVDEQTMYVLLYSLGPRGVVPEVVRRPFLFMEFGGRRILVDRQSWCFAPEGMADVVRRTAPQFTPGDGGRVLWMVSSGWEYAQPLNRDLPGPQVAYYREMGPYRLLGLRREG